MGEVNTICKICECWQPNVCFVKDPEICIDCLSKNLNSLCDHFISEGDKPSAPIPCKEISGKCVSPKSSYSNFPEVRNSDRSLEVVKDE